jgi:hypothetical protein
VIVATTHQPFLYIVHLFDNHRILFIVPNLDMDVLAAYESDSGQSSELYESEAVAQATTASGSGSVHKAGPEGTVVDPLKSSTRSETFSSSANGENPKVGDNPSIVCWNKNYIAERREGWERNRSIQSDSFVKVAEAIGETSSWVENLKQQNDFYNPHFFDTVVDRYQIKHTFGTNLPSPSTFGSWESNVFHLEEQARLREQQER